MNLITVPTLPHADLTKADMLLLKFCRQFEALYGKDYVRIAIAFGALPLSASMESLEVLSQTIDLLKFN